MAYAIIEMGGKQYRVEKGDSVIVDRVPEDEGAKVSPRALMFRSNETLLDGPDLAKVKVEAVVVEHLKGEKIRVFKYRQKKRYRKRAGHRSLLTRLEIREIHGPSAAKAAAGSAKGRKPDATASDGSDEQPQAADKPAAEPKDS